MGRASVSDKQEIQIETLLNDGQSQRTVAKKVGVSQLCVKNAFTKMKRNVLLKNAPSQGRKRATTSSDDHYLLQLCKQDRTEASRQLSSKWLLSSGKTVSDSTVLHRLLEGLDTKAMLLNQSQFVHLHKNKNAYPLQKVI